MSGQGDDAAGVPVERLRWACETLKIAGPVAAEAVPGILLDRLDEADGVPPSGWRQALRLMADPARPLPPPDRDAFLQADESRQRAEVDAFAAGFFDLAPAERRLRWESLIVQCEPYAPLVARLRALKEGLDVERPAQTGEARIDALAAHLCRMYVLTPVERERAHWDFLASCSQAGPEGNTARPSSKSANSPWSAAAECIRLQQPRLFLLCPGLLNRVGENPWDRGREEARARSAIGAASANPSSAPQPKSGSGFFTGGGTGLVIVVVIIALRALSALNSSSYTPPPKLPARDVENARRALETIEKQAKSKEEEDELIRSFAKDLAEKNRRLQQRRDGKGNDSKEYYGEAARRLFGIEDDKDGNENQKNTRGAAKSKGGEPAKPTPSSSLPPDFKLPPGFENLSPKEGGRTGNR
jgi:hypothetical protein